MTQSELNKLCYLKRDPLPSDAVEIRRLEDDVLHFCDTLFDPLTAECVRLRYLSCFSWDKIADVIGVGTGDAIRKRVSRFVKGLPL